MVGESKRRRTVGEAGMSGMVCGGWKRWLVLLVSVLAAVFLATAANETVKPANAASTLDVIEAESMSLSPSTAGTVFVDNAASNGRGLLFNANTTASKNFTGAASGITVRARGDQCGSAAPRMVIKVDGTVATTKSVSSKTWTEYSVGYRIPSGDHSVTITYDNDYKTSACNRNLRVDKVTFTVNSAEFVGRSGASFTLNGAPFRFAGANAYNAAGDPTIYECGPWMERPEEELDAWFASLENDSGSKVVRFWAYQSYTNGGGRWDTQGNTGVEWDSLDRVMRLANKHGIKVIPVLENQWADCTRGGYKYDTWYANGYLQPYGGYSISYKEYVKRVVERYRNEPAVAAWTLMNEAESKATDGSAKPEALYTFARDMSNYVKSIDKNHLVTLGVIGGAQPGVGGANYERLHSLPNIDFLEYHDYGANDEAMPGAPLEPLAPLTTRIYTQDGDWTWNDQSSRRNKARSWEEWTGTVPEGMQPFQRIGIDVYGDFAGDVYVDEIEVGSRIYDFEDGTAQGWQASGAASASNASDVSYAGDGSLKLTRPAAEGAQLWIPAEPEDAPGTPITVRVYVDTPGSATEYSDTLARAMEVSRKLNKPILVGEAGMLISGSSSDVETFDSRARKFDAKMGAFFGEGGDGYLIWAWVPPSYGGANRDHNFTTGDPLNPVIARYASTF